MSRPQLDRMLDHLRPGDVVVVWRLDRLGQSLKNLIALVEDLAERGVGFRIDRVDRHHHGQREAVLLDHGGLGRVRAGTHPGADPGGAGGGAVGVGGRPSKMTPDAGEGEGGP